MVDGIKDVGIDLHAIRASDDYLDDVPRLLIWPCGVDMNDRAT